MRRTLAPAAVLALLAALPAQEAPPNVVVILADDLGIGDLGCFNPRSKVPTPRLDELAAQGVRCTDAHSPSSVCTPTRYGLLTGRYAWRSRMKRGVLQGYDRLLVEPGRATIASVLAERGYHTACFGKWHLGLGAYDPEHPGARTDYGAIDAGPHTVGFDRALVLPASLDMPPYVYVSEKGVTEAATAETPGSKRRWDGGGGFWRAGAMAPGFDFYGVLPTFTDAAVDYLAERAREPDRPFFLYLPLPAPHTPWMPTAEFRGKSEAGWYGDFVAQVDHSVGRVLDALREHGFEEDTLVIVTSDNGSHWRPRDVAEFDHAAHLGYRGMKADIWEAGHRVPLLARWPGRIEPRVCDALLGLQDLFATVAAAAGARVAEGQAEDSIDALPAWRGAEPLRTELVHHSMDGMFALRKGRWKLIEGLGSGGFTAPRRAEPEEGAPAGQLYDLTADPAETRNLYGQEPEVVRNLSARLAELRR